MSSSIFQISWDVNSQNEFVAIPKRVGQYQHIMGTAAKSDGHDPQAQTLRLIMETEFRLANPTATSFHGAQTWMANKLHVTVNSLNNWLNGYRIPELFIDRVCAEWSYLKPEFIRRQERDRMTPAALERLGIMNRPWPPKRPPPHPRVSSRRTTRRAG